MVETIILTKEQMKLFIENAYGHDHNIEGIEGFKNFHVDTEVGYYDSEKGSVIDYLLEMTSPKGDLYQAWAGYYNGPVGHVFNYNVIFNYMPFAQNFEQALERAGFSRRQRNTILDIYKKYAT